jgi:hypothetical protein
MRIARRPVAKSRAETPSALRDTAIVTAPKAVSITAIISAPIATA